MAFEQLGKIIQESLLPGTKALPAGTVEISKVYRKKAGELFLIRYRQPDGTTAQRTEKDPILAHEYFWKCADELAKPKATLPA